MKSKIKTTLAGIIMIAATIQLGLMPPSSANAGDTLAEFFEGMEGSYRGRGKTFPSNGSGPIRVTCQILNAYSANAKRLTIAGDCASTQGKSRVKGTLSHNGNNVSGSFISPFSGVTMTKSNGVMRNNQLVVVSSFFDEHTGELSQMRQVIRKTKKGFRTEFHSFDKTKKKYLSAGTLTFSKK